MGCSGFVSGWLREECDAVSWIPGIPCQLDCTAFRLLVCVVNKKRDMQQKLESSRLISPLSLHISEQGRRKWEGGSKCGIKFAGPLDPSMLRRSGDVRSEFDYNSTLHVRDQYTVKPCSLTFYASVGVLGLNWTSVLHDSRTVVSLVLDFKRVSWFTFIAFLTARMECQQNEIRFSGSSVNVYHWFDFEFGSEN